MATIIRYVTDWQEGDAFLADGQCGSGVWVTASRGIAPKEFPDEAAARRFLLEHKYDLPASQVIFESDVSRFLDSPLTRCSHATLPLLIEAYDRLHGLAAPKATRIAERIGALLAEIIDIGGDVEAYGNMWCGGDMAQLASNIRAATAEYNDI